MTIPFTPGGGNTLPSINPLQGTIAGAGFSALAGRTQANVTAALQSQLAGDNTWSVLWDQFWEFISAPFEWVFGILERMFPNIPWAEMEALDLGEQVEWLWDQVEEVLLFTDFQGVLELIAENPEEFFGSIGNVAVDGSKSFGDFLTELWEAFTGLFAPNRKTISDVTTAASDLKNKTDVAYDNAQSVEALAKDVISAGSNIVKNAGFENIFFQQFGSLFSAQLKRSGTFALKLNGTGAFTASYSLVSDSDLTPTNIAVTAGDVYYAEVWVRGAASNTQTSGGAGAVRMLFQPYDQANNVLADSIISLTASTALSGQWNKLSGYITMPPNAKWLVMKLQLTPDVPLGDSYFFDDVTVREVTLASTATAAAGSAQTSADAANNNAVLAQGAAQTADDKAVAADNKAKSASELALEVISSSANLIKNPGFENIFFQQAGSMFTLLQKRSGLFSLMLTGSASGAKYTLLSDTGTSRALSVSAGDTLYAEVWVRGAGGNQTSGAADSIKMVFEPLNGSGTAIAGGAQVAAGSVFSTSPSAALNGDWQKLSGYVTMPAGTASLRISLELTSAITAGKNYFFDDVVVRELTLARSAFIESGLAQSAAGAASNSAALAQSAAATADGKAVVAQSAAATADGKAVAAQGSANTAKALANSALQAGPNLAVNPGFENTSIPLAGDGSYSTAQARTGSRSVVMTGASDWRTTWLTADETGIFRVLVSPGDSYYAEFWVRGSGASTGLVLIAAEVRNASGTVIDYPLVGQAVSTSLNNTWTKVSGIIKMPENAVTASFFVQLNNAVPSGTFYFDDVSVFRVTESIKTNQALYSSNTPNLTINSGAVPGLEGSKITSGTIAEERVQNLTSTKNTANLARSFAEDRILHGANLIGNPSFESTEFVFSGQPTFTRSNEIARTGSWSVRCAPDAVYREFLPATTSTNSNITFKATAGDTYYFEFWLYGRSTNSNTTSGGIYGQFVGVDRDGVYVENGIAEIFTGPALKNKWTKCSGTYTFKDANTAGFYFQIAHTSAIASGDIYFIDDVVLREASAGNLARDLTKSGLNLISDPGFESNNRPLVRFGTSWTITNEIARSGSRCAKLGPNIVPWNNIVISLDDVSDVTIPAAVNDVYYIEFWIRGHQNNSNTTAGEIYVIVDMVNSAGSGLGNVNIYALLGPALKNTWTKISGYVKISNPNTTSIKVLIANSGGIPVNDIYYIDDVIVREATFSANTNQALYGQNVPALTINSGAVPGLEGSKITSGTVAEERVQNLSTIRNATIQLSTSGSNLAPDPSFENTSAYFFTAGNAVLSTDYARTGTRSARVTAGGGYNTFAALATNGVDNMASFACREGDEFYFEGWVRAHPNNVGGGSVYVSCEIKSGSTVIDYRTPSGAVVDTNNPAFKSGFVKISGYVTVPANGTGINPLLLVGWSVPAGDRYYWDDVTFREVTESTVAKSIAVSASQSGSNFATNPGFENTALWMDTIRVSGDFIGEYSTEQKRSGARSLKLLGGYNYRDLFSNDKQFIRLPCNPGDRFYAEIWVYGHNNNAATGEVFLQADCYDINNTRTEFLDWWKWQNAQVRFVAGSTDLKNKWTKLYGEFIIPANTRDFVVTAVQSGGSNIYYWDDFVVKQVTTSYLLGENAVTSGKIASGAVTGEKTAGLDGSKITGGQVAEGLVQNLTSTKNTANSAQTAATNVTESFRQALKSAVNLCSNPGFEDDQAAAGWQLAQLSYDTGIKLTGSRSLRIKTASPDDVYFYLGGTRFGETFFQGAPNRKYYVEGWVYAAPGNQNAISSAHPVLYLGVWFYDRNSANITASTIEISDSAAIKGQWVKFSGTISAPNNPNVAYARGLGVTPGWAGLGANNFYYVDDVVVKDITEAYDADQRIITTNQALYSSNNANPTINSGAVPQIDGSKINTGTVPEDRVQGLTTIKNTANSARSVSSALSRSGANVVANPGFEFTDFVHNKDADWSISTAMPRRGLRSARYISNNRWQAMHVTSDTSDTIYVPATAGETYYLEFWVRGDNNNSSTNSGGLHLQIITFDSQGSGSDGSFYIHQGCGPSLKNVWTKVSGYVTLTNPNTAMFYAQVLSSDNIPVGDIYYIDDIVIREASAAANTNKALYNANTPSSTILAGAVPGLEGSKITSGTVAEARVQNLSQVRSTVEGVATSSNMLISPNFDNTSISRFGYDGTALQYTNAAGYVHQGSHSITWQTNNGWNGISLAPTQTSEFYSMREGESIGVSARIKRDANNNNSSGQVYLFMRWLNSLNLAHISDSWNGSLNQFSNAGLPSGWQDMVNFGTCPAGANALQIMLISSPDTPNGNKYYVDSAAVYRMVNPAEISSGAVTQEKIANGAVTGDKTAQLDGSKITGGLVAESRVENLPAIKTTANTTKTAVDQFSEIVSGLVVTPINNAVTSFSNWFSNLLGWQSNTQNFQISAITGGTATKQPVWVCRYPIADVSYPEILNTLFTTFGTTDSVAAASGDASSTVTGAASAGTAHTHSTTHTHPGVAHSHSIAQQTANPALRVCAPGQSGGGFITITQNAVYDTMGMVARRDSSGTPNNVFMELFRVRPDGQMERIRSVDISSQLTTTVQYIEVSIAGQVVQPGERYMVRIRNSSTNAENVNVRGARSLGGSIFSGFDTGTAAVSEKTTYTSSEISTYTTDTARWALFGTTTQVANDQSFSDDFNRSNLGTLWSPASTTGSNQIVLVSGKSQFGGTTNGDQHAIYLRPTGSNNQRVEANITGTFLNGTFGGIMMHCSRDGSQVVYLAVNGFGCKLFTGSWNSLIERASNVTSGDGLWSMYFNPSDSRYYVQKNGVQVFSWQDAGGSPIVNRSADFRYGGIRHRREGIGINSGAIDNWTLRDFTA